MKYFNNYKLFKKLFEQIDLTSDSENLLNQIKKEQTLPLLSIKNNTDKSYIKLLQEILNSQGYDLKINSIFDETTKEAVINFQSSEGLTKDGIVGKNTWKNLLTLADVNINPIIKGTVVKKATVQPINNPETSKEKVVSNLQIKDIKGNLVSFDKLKNATNKWWDNKDTVEKLIINNKSNKEIILEFNKLYQERSGRNLITFLIDVYSKSKAFKFELYDVLTNYIIQPELDAKIFNYGITGLGTNEELINMLINKRSRNSKEYKDDILKSYQENYNASFAEDMLDDGISEDIIKKIDVDYFETE